MNDETAEGRASGFLPGLVAGAAVGAALGLFLAPRPGRETLALFVDRSEELGERLADLLEEARDVIRVALLRSGSPDPEL